MQYSHVRKNVLVVDVRLTHTTYIFFSIKKEKKENPQKKSSNNCNRMSNENFILFC